MAIACRTARLLQRSCGPRRQFHREHCGACSLAKNGTSVVSEIKDLALRQSLRGPQDALGRREDRVTIRDEVQLAGKVAEFHVRIQ